LRNEKGWIVGYADCVIQYTDLNNNVQKGLIEFKSYFSDVGELKRQIETYASFLKNVTRKAVVYKKCDVEGRDIKKLVKYNNYFESQKIRFIHFDEMTEDFEEKEDDLEFWIDPKVPDLWPAPIGQTNLQLLTIDLQDKLFDKKITACFYCGNEFGRTDPMILWDISERDQIKGLINFIGMTLDGDKHEYEADKIGEIEVEITSYEPFLEGDRIVPMPIIKNLKRKDKSFTIRGGTIISNAIGALYNRDNILSRK
jgi:hypothetical protein